MICVDVGVNCRDIEKVSNEVFTAFENMQTSTSSVISSSTELTNAYDKDPTLKSTLSHYKNMYLLSTSKLEKEIVIHGSLESYSQKSRIEDNIFAKVEIRREVLSSIHKRIEECSQLDAHYTNVSNNLASIRSDPNSLSALSPTELSDVVSPFPLNDSSSRSARSCRRRCWSRRSTWRTTSRATSPTRGSFSANATSTYFGIPEF